MGNTLTLLSGGGTDEVSAANGVRSSPTRRPVLLPLRSTDHPPILRFRTLIDFSQALPTEPHLPHAVLHGRPHAHALSPERLADLPFLSPEREPARLLHSPNHVCRTELQLRQLFRERPPARLVSAPRNCQVQGLMRTLVVVDDSPLIEPNLALSQITEHTPLQHLCHQPSMKPLFLPLRLRMLRTPVTHSHSQPQQPHRQWCPRTLSIVPPRRSVVHQHGLRQPIPPKRLLQSSFNRLPLFIPAGLQHQ